MATPDISTTISEAYSRGLDRMGPWFPSLAVVAGASGLIAGALAQTQSALVPDASDVLGGMFGSSGSLNTEDLRTIQLLSLIGTVVSLVLSFGASVVFAGQFHRERHGEARELPNPGLILPAVFAGFTALMPRIALIFGLFVLGQLVTAFAAVLGGLISFAGIFVLIYLGIRWVYASVIVGSGEASGDAAFDRSAEVVDGSWWGTFGVFIVIGLATTLPVMLVGAVVGGIVPGTFLSAFAMNFVMTLGAALLGAAALESAWAQVEAGDGPGDFHGGAHPEAHMGDAGHPAPYAPPGTPSAPGSTAGPADASHPPTTLPSGDDVVGDDDRERGPFV